jgi:hypothetical protein
MILASQNINDKEKSLLIRETLQRLVKECYHGDSKNK